MVSATRLSRYGVSNNKDGKIRRMAVSTFRRNIVANSVARKRGKSRGGGRFVIAGLVLAISIRKAQRADYRDGREKPGHDQVETLRVLHLLVGVRAIP
jgi:hypothetical protein